MRNDTNECSIEGVKSLTRGPYSTNILGEMSKVEFVVLHYTAVTRERTLEIFRDPERKVAAHLVIDIDGSVYEVVQCLTSPIQTGRHAGKSRLDVGGRHFEEFNYFSLGIEIVNFNGNLFPFTEAQYTALSGVLKYLQARHPELRSPERIVGHEEIAGWRGKSDPGFLFDWKRLFTDLFGANVPIRSLQTVCTAEMRAAFLALLESAGIDPETPPIDTRFDPFSEALSLSMERAVNWKINNQK